MTTYEKQVEVLKNILLSPNCSGIIYDAFEAIDDEYKFMTIINFDIIMILLKQNIPMNSDIDVDMIVNEVLNCWKKPLNDLKNISKEDIINDDGIIELEIDEEE